MHELPWTTIFLVTRDVICLWFSLVTSFVKITGKTHHEWPKIVIHGNESIILCITRYIMSWTHKYVEKPSSIVHFAIYAKEGLFWLSIVTSPHLIWDVTRTRGTSIMTSSSSIVLARANWRKSDLHLWITTVNIDFSPPAIHGLACKKSSSKMMLLQNNSSMKWKYFAFISFMKKTLY